MKQFLMAVCFSAITVCVFSGETLTCPVTCPFSKGVNLSQWFECESPQSFNFAYFSYDDLKNVKEMGGDTIRLPIHFENLSSGSSDYIIDEYVLTCLDNVISWAEELELYLIIDNHSFDSSRNTPSNIQKRLQCIWTQIAQRYKNRSQYILYEILNEPHGITAAKWGRVQGKIIDVIRTIDTKHTIIVGGADWNSFRSLDLLPVYTDTNLIYTYHFYEPMVFTHQGATWTDYKNSKRIPFPYKKADMPPLSKDIKKTWVVNELQHYMSEAADSTGTVENLYNCMKFASEFSQKRNVPVFCGEFGVMMTYAQNDDRATWYKTVRTILEKSRIAWTSWDYFGNFGLYNNAAGGIYPNDINKDIADALGFTPSKQNKERQSLQTPFYLYKDGCLQLGVSADRVWGDGYLFLHQYAKDKTPVIEWGNCKRYGSLTWRFFMPLDIQKIKSENAFVVISLCADFPGKTIQLRFKNPENANSMPWRNCIDISCGKDAAYSVPNDGEFHTLRIPLSDFKETGAWINSKEKWYPHENRFDWTHIECLEFTAEYESLKKCSIQIRDISIEM